MDPQIKSTTKTSRQRTNQARSEEKIEDLRSRLLDITETFDDKLTKQAYEKSRQDITGAQRLVKLQNMNSEYVEALRAIKTGGKRVSLVVVQAFNNVKGEAEKPGAYSNRLGIE